VFLTWLTWLTDALIDRDSSAETHLP
jgi:hypothetical protein